jgi:glycosyltransferase involved in cell wall biosynthesis
MVTVSDQALVHPRLLGPLVEGRGRMPDPDAPLPLPTDAIARAALEDFERSDAVVVSSPFVKETFMRAGWTPERVHVAYTGIDENFFHYGELPLPRRSAPSGPLPLLFASVLSRRKGAETLVEALELVGSRIDWDLVVAGPVGPDIAAKHRSFFADPRVEVLGNLARPQFKAQLIARGVFPSRATPRAQPGPSGRLSPVAAT